MRRGGEGGTYDVSNGLLLWIDLHALFDCGLIRLHPDSHRVLAHPRPHERSYQTDLGDAILRVPALRHRYPDLAALA